MDQIRIGILDAYRPIINKGLDEVRPITMPAEMGVGKRVTIPIKLDEHLFIEIFSETYVSGSPCSPAMGFTEEEVVSFDGVAIQQILKPIHGKARSSGIIVRTDEFTTKYITDPLIHLKLHRLWQTGSEDQPSLRDASRLGDKFLEQINAAWINRDLGSTSVFGTAVGHS